MFLKRMSSPATAAVKLLWSRALTHTIASSSNLATLAIASRETYPSFLSTRTLHTSRADADETEGAANSTDSSDTPTVPAWLDIDPAVVQDVLGDVTLKKFQFRQVVDEVFHLERIGFPIPEEKITRDQLETLISLKRVRCRNMYIHALSGLANCPDPDDVVRMDREWPDTIFTEEQVASVAGDEEMAARLRLAQYCEQNLVNMGEILPPKVNDRWFRAILRRSSEAGVRKMQGCYYHCNNF